ncbi:hypothetical protein TNCV_1439541 [Trichonephila clavipes]|nr:hypothetical protein TNCV_1439541 [Trichonephila clavipes]
MVLKANDRRTSCPCHDEFRGPRSDYVRQHCFQSAFRRDSSSKPETDECHLVQNQDIGIGSPNQELQYGFALPLPSVVSHCHPTTERKM